MVSLEHASLVRACEHGSCEHGLCEHGSCDLALGCSACKSGSYELDSLHKNMACLVHSRLSPANPAHEHMSSAHMSSACVTAEKGE